MPAVAARERSQAEAFGDMSSVGDSDEDVYLQRSVDARPDSRGSMFSDIGSMSEQTEYAMQVRAWPQSSPHCDFQGCLADRLRWEH